MKKQIFNPYMPSWEYVPDGEPHVFGDRVYVYGSHDMFNGCVFCLGDYVCYSAPVTDLTDWKYEGVIYRKDQDPVQDGRMVLYAPDVTVGPDGRYYLYYVFDKVGFVSVAVCDTPAGKYEFYGHVHYKDGTRMGDREGDMPQFDPAVITEGNKTYLYTGFCGNHMKDRIGAMATVLGPDMLTVEEEPVVIIPGDEYAKKDVVVETGCKYKLDSVENWPAFKNHEFFEAPSIRKVGDTYYFVFSSAVMHELCYATSKQPTSGFVYGGVIVSNCDVGIDSYKPADMPAAYGANNHGGFELINGEYYMFYHRHTNGNWYSRQGCAEKIRILEDGTIPQVEITSCGLNGGPLKAEGEYGAYIACNMFVPSNPNKYVGAHGCPTITQDGVDGDQNPGYIKDIPEGTVIGFKYFEFKNVKKITITTRGYFYGGYEVRTKWDGPAVGFIDCLSSNFWEEYSGEVSIPDGVSALYLVSKASGNGQLAKIKFN
ncbi:family 43 glycosylhydrolase [Treponema sp.]|uniref:family 43 glycosylhydrolase n=1 Tax=Treponema sp. TaxID=166 RepID=UPI00298E661D|nr:family 43 glycosylhydrolase [Treponema sp.]MCQ2241657.1 family 43 glycosylhydrolase [Treponema sp.]